MLFTEVRDSDLKVKLMLFLTPALAFGVMLRLIVGVPYRFADFMLEGSFLLGLLGGRVVGPLGGSIVSLPAFFPPRMAVDARGRRSRGWWAA